MQCLSRSPLTRSVLGTAHDGPHLLRYSSVQQATQSCLRPLSAVLLPDPPSKSPLASPPANPDPPANTRHRSSARPAPQSPAPDASLCRFPPARSASLPPAASAPQHPLPTHATPRTSAAPLQTPPPPRPASSQP